MLPNLSRLTPTGVRRPLALEAWELTNFEEELDSAWMEWNGALTQERRQSYARARQQSDDLVNVRSEPVSEWVRHYLKEAQAQRIRQLQPLLDRIKEARGDALQFFESVTREVPDWRSLQLGIANNIKSVGNMLETYGHAVQRLRSIIEEQTLKQAAVADAFIWARQAGEEHHQVNVAKLKVLLKDRGIWTPENERLGVNELSRLVKEVESYYAQVTQGSDAVEDGLRNAYKGSVEYFEQYAELKSFPIDQVDRAVLATAYTNTVNSINVFGNLLRRHHDISF